MSSDDLERMVQTADDVVDYVKLMFLVDLGEGHIDHFESSDGPPAPALIASTFCMPPAIAPAIVLTSAAPFVLRKEAAIPRDPPKYRTPYGLTSFLRGPPAPSFVA